MGLYSIYPVKPVDSMAARVLGIPKKSQKKKKRRSRNRKRNRNRSNVIVLPVVAKTQAEASSAPEVSRAIVRRGGDPKHERVVHHNNAAVTGNNEIMQGPTLNDANNTYQYCEAYRQANC